MSDKFTPEKLADLRARHKTFIAWWRARHPNATFRQASQAWKSHIGERGWKGKDTRQTNKRKLAVLSANPEFRKYLQT